MIGGMFDRMKQQTYLAVKVFYSSVRRGNDPDGDSKIMKASPWFQ